MTEILTDLIRPLIERELADIRKNADILVDDDIESRAHDLTRAVVAVVYQFTAPASPMLTWKDSPHGSEYGHVGDLRVFTVSWGTTREEGRPYVLDSTLPQMPKGKRYASRDEAKQDAEKKLARYLRYLSNQGARAAL